MRVRGALRNISVGIKLLAIMGLLALTAVVVGGSGLHVIHVYNDKVAAIQRASERAVIGEQINGLINAAVMDSRGVYLAKNASEVEKFSVPLLANLNRIEERIAHWSGLIDPGTNDIFTECVEKLRGFIALRRELVEAARIQGAEAANIIGNNDTNRTSREQVNKAVVALARHNADDVGRLAQEMSQFAHEMSTFMPACVAAGIAVVAILAVSLVIGGITRPLSRITNAMRQLAAGEVDVEVTNLDQGDEIGLMADALEVFRVQAVENRRLTESQGKQRQEAEEQKRLALTGMAETIEATASATIQEINRQGKALANTADEMRARAARTGASAAAAATASAAAAANAGTVASAGDVLGASIREISVQVEQSTRTVARAVNAGEEARSVIDALTHRVGQIGAVADMISDIAAKTNLLALNATIEAARAGEAGKGFAVVASEVKQLAHQTAASTQEIARHITDVRSATAAAVEAVARIEATIGEISTTAGAISAAVVEQGSVTAAIGRNVAETAAAIRDITDRNAEVSAEAELGGQQAAVVLEATQELNAAVGNLKAAIVRAVRGSAAEIDRRFFRRVAVDLPCWVELEDRTRHQIRLVDLSEGGARFAGPLALTPGTRGKLHLDQVRTAASFLVVAQANDEVRVSFEKDADASVTIRAFLEAAQQDRAA